MKSVCLGIWKWLRRLAAKPARSLRGRLLYTLLALLVVLLGMQTTEHFSRLHSRRVLLDSGYERAAAATAAALRGSLEQLFRSQAVLASAALSSRMYPEQINAFVREARARYPGLASLQIIASPGGRILFADPEPRYDNHLGSEQFFLELSARAPYYISPEMYRDDPAATEKVRIASWIRSEIGSASVVSMEFYREGLQAFMPYQASASARILLDASGRPLFQTGHTRETLPRAALDQALQRSKREKRAVALTGTDGAVAPVPGTSWWVVYLPSQTEALAQVSQDTRNALLLVASVVLVLAITILVVASLSLRPVVALSAAARKLGSGDFALRLPPAEVQEFETLVEAFNRMAGQLEQTREQLVDANRNLDAQVRQRTEQLIAEHEKLLRAERLSTLGLFSSAIAHDLRNPLNTVSLSAQWLQLRFADDPDEKLRARLETIQREVRRSEEIIRTLLAFARTGEPRREPLNLCELVEDVLHVASLPESVHVRKELPKGLPPVPADRTQLFQVVENLIGNAVQAMDGVGELRIAAFADDDWYHLEIRDTGPGVPRELQASVFEPLVTTKSTGTGLGLALCKRIVEAHGGRIGVESAPGEGAAFRIALPFQPPLRGVPDESPDTTDTADPTGYSIAE